MLAPDRVQPLQEIHTYNKNMQTCMHTYTHVVFRALTLMAQRTESHNSNSNSTAALAAHS